MRQRTGRSRPAGRRGLHIGLVSTAYWPIIGGAEVYLHRLAGALVEQGHEVTVATRFTKGRPDHMRGVLTGTEGARQYRQAGVAVHVLAPAASRRWMLWPTYRLHYYTSTQSLARRLFRASLKRPLHEALATCDIVHYSGTGRELLGFCAAHTAERVGAPLFITSHMHVGAWGDGALDFQLYRQADRMIALTEYEKEVLIERGARPAAVRVLGHGVNVQGGGDGDAFRRRHQLGEAPVVLFLGRKAAYKGYGLLLEAAARVWQSVPEARFVFAGPAVPEDERLSAQAATALRDRRVVDLGRISDAEREDAYAACDVFCLPSEGEAFGLVYLEAWAYQRPVVALDIPTLRELVAGTGGGLLAQPQPASVAGVLVDLLQDESLRRRLGQNGGRRARKSTWKDVAARMSYLYHAALSAPSSFVKGPAQVCTEYAGGTSQ